MQSTGARVFVLMDTLLLDLSAAAINVIAVIANGSMNMETSMRLKHISKETCTQWCDHSFSESIERAELDRNRSGMISKTVDTIAAPLLLPLG